MLGMGIYVYSRGNSWNGSKCSVAAVFWNLEMPISEEQTCLK